jgi:hypothetical protein
MMRTGNDHGPARQIAQVSHVEWAPETFLSSPSSSTTSSSLIPSSFSPFDFTFTYDKYESLEFLNVDRPSSGNEGERLSLDVYLF